MSEGLFWLNAAIAATFLLAGFVKGVIGLGLPTVAIGLLGLVMTPVQAVSLLVVPSLVTNIWQLLAGPRILPLLRRLWTMLLGFCAGTCFSAVALDPGASERNSMLLGVALIAYAIVGLSKKRFSVPAHAETWLSPLVGALTGVVATATGVFVLPAVPYLQALDLDKEELVQALGLSFTVSTLGLAAVLAVQGNFQMSVAGASLASLLPALCGMLLGQAVRTRVRAETFRRCFFIGLLALGVHLAWRFAG
ncbi:sulfite exporter TauE/SafE family protein [Noviherbaspirillum saxi]|uniref:Probable membrane transporter protein n=1 Tax=Noviherbaspirillum saxi TaxID=2320863 RepID=A0A3A3FP80_9BURK|nr:sulfite exporter TauE/SafE family protein [Noviherbaspirillum saxi]RJF97693.1 sulfite exporter TauE/SafE family protein [Noviherbaspirillum saxi]